MAITDTWDTDFNAEPAGIDNLAEGDDKIRQTRRAVYERAYREHLWNAVDTNSKHGWLREGAARAFVAASAPTAYNDTDATSLGSDAAIDQGRLWFDSDANYLPRVYDSGWCAFLREIARVSIQGALATGTAVVPPIVVPRACTPVKITAHLFTPPVGSSIIIDFNKNGSSTIFNTAGGRLTIADGDSEGSTTDISAALAIDDYLTMDIDQVGSTTAGADIGITLEFLL